jgi:hypothetical protein
VAKIHIAMAQLGLNAGEYEMSSALRLPRRDMTLPNWEPGEAPEALRMEARKSRKDWTGRPPGRPAQAVCGDGQTIDNGERAWPVCLSICGVSTIAVCRGRRKLVTASAVLGKIKVEKNGNERVS